MIDKKQHTLPEFIRFGRAICGDLAQAERREWWLSNGLGAYASGTVAGTLTRRYHGLLIAPIEPPLGRRLLLAKAEATWLDGSQEIPLFSNRWGGGTMQPTGYVHLESFQLEGRMPVWRYAWGDQGLEQRIWLEPGAHTVYVAYRLTAPADRELRLRVRLLVNARDHHLTTQPGDFSVALEQVGPQWRVAMPKGGTLHLQTPGGVLHPDGEWFENFDLSLERERGLPDRDAHWSVGQALLALRADAWVGVTASLEPYTATVASVDLAAAIQRFQDRDAALLERARPMLGDAPPDWIEQLTLAADSFLFARPVADVADGESVIAGYPWFGDWGRDTMIALPGLTLSTGRFDSARRILRTFARFVDQGLLPNVFPGAGETPAYNAVDAALWYFEAWRAYQAASADQAALVEVFPVLAAMIECYIRGTRYQIGQDATDGLLKAGEPGVQLTWMDAKAGDWVVTPRIGKPVEINALWYNALKIMAAFAEQLDRPVAGYAEVAAQVRHGFQRFIRPDGHGLYDVLDGPTGHDPTVRPNQLFAVSLAHSPLDADLQRAVVRECGQTLLTSYGLRSLLPAHPNYHPHYCGDVWQRDGGYHQGAVWAWLLGHYVWADYRMSGDAAAAQARLSPIRDHLLDGGLGTVSEIFDGAPPHSPRGAPAQAWSVACVLEAWQRLECLKNHDIDAIHNSGG